MRIPKKIISLRLAVAIIVDVMLFSSSSSTSPLVSSLALALSVSSLLWSSSSSITTENNYRTTTGSSCNSGTSSTTESYSMATIFAFSSSVSAFASSASSLRRRSATSNADIVARAGISNNNGLQWQQQQQQQQSRATQQVGASLLVLQANTKPDWLEESMKEFNKDQNKNDDSSTSNNCDINTTEDDVDSDSADGTTNNIRLRTILKAMKKMSGSSLVGFAVDPAVGFCAILVVDDGDNARGGFFPVVISTRDRDQLTSPEALTLVQLAGGLDLGTPILPPDLLAKLVTEEEENEDGEDDDTIPAVVAAVAAATVGQRITLTSIEIVLDPTPPTNDDTSNTKGEHEDNDDDDDDDDDDTNVKSCSSASSSSERDTAIRDLLPRLRVAIQGLPGITASCLDETQIETAMQRYADGAGKVNRDAFTKILDMIRRNDPQGGGNTTPNTSRVTFRLTATIISGTSLRTVQFNTNNAMYAIGLSLRYTIPIQAKLLPAAAATTSFEEKDAVSSTSSLVSPIDMILEKFPAYRPIYELYEDAKVMDGFIPSMFQQTKKIDNDMKE